MIFLPTLATRELEPSADLVSRAHKQGQLPHFCDISSPFSSTSSPTIILQTSDLTTITFAHAQKCRAMRTFMISVCSTTMVTLKHMAGSLHRLNLLLGIRCIPTSGFHKSCHQTPNTTSRPPRLSTPVSAPFLWSGITSVIQILDSLG